MPAVSSSFGASSCQVGGGAKVISRYFTSINMQILGIASAGAQSSRITVQAGG